MDTTTVLIQQAGMNMDIDLPDIGEGDHAIRFKVTAPKEIYLSNNLRMSSLQRIILQIPPVPSVAIPNSFNANGTTSSTVDMSWTVGTGGVAPTGYELDRSLTGTNAQTPGAAGWTNVFSGSATTFQDTGRNASTAYFYRVRAVSSGVFSPGYAVDNATTLAPPVTTRNVWLTVDWETGQAQAADTRHDGVFIKTLPNPQVGRETVQSGNGGFGPSNTSDTHVVASETVSGELITPRSGSFFLRSALIKSKDYRDLNNGVLDKPRSFINISNPPHRTNFDVEAWWGFSIRIPNNYEHETGSNGDAGYMMLYNVVGGDTDRSFLNLRHIVNAGQNFAHWDLRTHTDATSMDESIPARTDYNLGSVTPDIGKWTDFVLRWRGNPFSTTTNPSLTIPGAANQSFQGNKGILQVWKGEGAVDGSGNRAMTLKVNIVNAPFGLVPPAGVQLETTLRIYKGGWKKNPTDVIGPVWIGFDQVRFGEKVRDGTGFADVSPSGLAAP